MFFVEESWQIQGNVSRKAVKARLLFPRKKDQFYSLGNFMAYGNSWAKSSSPTEHACPGTPRLHSLFRGLCNSFEVAHPRWTNKYLFYVVASAYVTRHKAGLIAVNHLDLFVV